MDQWTSEAWEDAVRAVFRRALTDVPFRQLALRDPTEAFTQATGQPPPVSIRFVEALEEHVLVLPKLVQSGGEVSEIDVSRILFHGFRQQSLPPTLKHPPC
jgi:hypothetical protein